MKYNLKNRPKYEEKMHCKSWALNDVECWFVGFEAELREEYAYQQKCLRGARLDGIENTRMKFVRQILGE